MRKFLWFVLILAMCNDGFGQLLTVRGGMNLGFHQHRSKNRITDFPLWREEQAPDPAIKHYFSNRPGAVAQIGWRFFPEFIEPVDAIECGAVFEWSNLPNRNFDSRLVLGDQLRIVTVMTFATLGRSAIIDSYMYVLAGVGKSMARGTATAAAGVLSEGAVDIKAHFTNGWVFRIGVGGETVMTRNLLIIGELYFDWRRFDRGKIELFADGNKIAENQPLGFKELDDPTFGFTIQLAWQMSFSDKR